MRLRNAYIFVHKYFQYMRYYFFPKGQQILLVTAIQDSISDIARTRSMNQIEVWCVIIYSQSLICSHCLGHVYVIRGTLQENLISFVFLFKMAYLCWDILLYLNDSRYDICNNDDYRQQFNIKNVKSWLCQLILCFSVIAISKYCVSFCFLNKPCKNQFQHVFKDCLFCSLS